MASVAESVVGQPYIPENEGYQEHNIDELNVEGLVAAAIKHANSGGYNATNDQSVPASDIEQAMPKLNVKDGPEDDDTQSDTNESCCGSCTANCGKG